MIGDNPGSDIQGGNNSACVTILTRTGVFAGKGNDKKYPADYVVENFYEAIKLIFKIEGIPFK